MRHRRTIFIAGTLLLVASLALVAFMTQESAAELMTAALENLEAVESGHAIVTADVSLPDQSGSATVEVWAQKAAGPNGEPAFRVEVLEAQLPMELRAGHDPVGIIAVSDGEQFWLYVPAENTVFVGTATELAEMMAEQAAEHEMDRDGMPPIDPEAFPETAAEAVEMLLEYFEADRDGSDDLADGRAHQIQLIPIPEQMPDEVRAVGGLINLWIDAEQRVPVAVEYTGGAIGSARIAVSDLELNGDIDPNIFTFTPPPDAKIVRIVDMIPEVEELSPAERSDLLVPTAVPDGARLLETVDIAGIAVQQYALPDGGAFTVAQGAPNARFAPDDGDAVTRRVRDVNGTLFVDEAGERVLLTWIEGDTQFWIGGDLSADDAVRLASSLK